jgi:hypothetical protein
MIQALLLVPALASVSAHAAAFRRRDWARPRSRVQCCCAALAGGRAGRGGHCCSSGRESNCSHLVRARRSATCFCVPSRFMHHVRPRRAAGGAAWYGGGAAVWVQCLWCAVSSWQGRLDARRPPRNHSCATFEPFTLPDGVRAVGSKAHVVCCSSCHHRRLHLSHARLALACRRCSQQNHHALHGAAAARVRV